MEKKPQDAFERRKRSLFTDREVQEILRLLEKARKKNYQPPSGFDPIAKIIQATEFFLVFRTKRIKSHKQVRRDTKKFEKTVEPFIETVGQMEEDNLRILGLDSDWQEKTVEELFRASMKAPLCFLGGQVWQLVSIVEGQVGSYR